MAINVTGIVDARATTAKMTQIMTKTELETVALAVKQAGLVVERAAKKNIRGRHAVGTPRPDGGENTGDGTLMNVTSALRASITTTSPKRIGFGSYMVQVGPTMIYGRVQELGGGPSNLPARPYMAPALASSGAEIYAIYNRVWERSTR